MRELVVPVRPLVSMERSYSTAKFNSIASIIFFCQRSSTESKQRHDTPCR